MGKTLIAKLVVGHLNPSKLSLDTRIPNMKISNAKFVENALKVLQNLKDIEKHTINQNHLNAKNAEGSFQGETMWLST